MANIKIYLVEASNTQQGLVRSGMNKFDIRDHDVQ